MTQPTAASVARIWMFAAGYTLGFVLSPILRRLPSKPAPQVAPPVAAPDPMPDLSNLQRMQDPYRKPEPATFGPAESDPAERVVFGLEGRPRPIRPEEVTQQKKFAAWASAINAAEELAK